MRFISLLAMVAAAALPSCTFDPGGPGPGGPDDPAPDPTRDPASDVDAASTAPAGPDAAPLVYDVECHVSGDRLGDTGLRVKVGGEVVTFDHWTPDPTHAGQYIGFTLSPNAAGVRYGVSTTDWIYYAVGLVWSLPAQVHSPIERVDFCF